MGKESFIDSSVHFNMQRIELFVRSALGKPNKRTQNKSTEKKIGSFINFLLKGIFFLQKIDYKKMSLEQADNIFSAFLYK